MCFDIWKVCFEERRLSSWFFFTKTWQLTVDRQSNEIQCSSFSKRLFKDLREDTQCVGFVLSQQVICRWQFARLATTFVPLNLHLARRSVSWYHHNHYIITIMIPSQSWYHHNPDIITIMISSYIIISSHPVIITIMISSQSTIIDNALKMITDHLLLQHSSQRSCLVFTT